LNAFKPSRLIFLLSVPVLLAMTGTGIFTPSIWWERL